MNMINELPDDILVDVISLLTMKEAGRTSILSNRWRHISEYCPTLDFDFCEVFNFKSWKVKGRKYANWVDQVVNSHKALTIDEFKVQFEVNTLRRSSSKNVDNWFRFAMERRVKRLHIDLCYSGAPVTCHAFCSLPLCNSLTTLELGSLNISGEVLENCLCNCQALEHLSVEHSDSLVHLKVSNPLNLKHLSICYCDEVKELDISAPNLDVCYRGPKINVIFKSSPKLAQVTFGSSYADNLKDILSDLSSCLSQIKELTFTTTFDKQILYSSMERSLLFARLEKLDVEVAPKPQEDLFYFGSLIKACPILKRFKLQLLSFRLVDFLSHKRREHRKWEVYPHYNLKIVEIMGFVGHAVDVEFIAYLMESAVSLEKIIADTRCYLSVGTPTEFKETEKWRKGASEWAERLRADLKPGATLEFI